MTRPVLEKLQIIQPELSKPGFHLSPKSDYQNVFFGNDSKIGLLLFNVRCVVQLQICQIENERTLSNCPN